MYMEIVRLIFRLASAGPGLGAALVAGSVAAAAQPISGQTPSDPSGVSVVSPPPPGYNPLSESASANAQFALPPAPNPVIAPGAFGAWRNAVTAAQNREPSTLTSTNLFNGPTDEKPSTPALAQPR
jgi:hypothetical protein